MDVAGTLVRRARAFNLHEAAFLALVDGGDALVVRGARNEAVVAALMLAAAPTGGEKLFTTKVTRLAAFTAVLEEPLRSHIADLFDGALTADAAARTAEGSARPDRGFPGWMAPAIVPTTAPASWWVLKADDLARYAGQAASGDPDYVLLSAIATVRGMLAPPSHGERAEAGYDAIERSGLALCAAVPASRAERADARRVVLILWLALRRRRPLAAAILRTKLRLDRVRWGAGDAGG